MLFSPNFKEIWILSTKFRIILKCQISFKSIPWEPSCSIRSDRQTSWSYGPLFAISRTRPKTDHTFTLLDEQENVNV